MTSNSPVRSDAKEARRASPLQRVRSYLSDELVSRFELSNRFRAPSTASPEQRSPSNFVRRLVASLERRGKDASPIGRALSANFEAPGSPGVGASIGERRSWRRSGCGIDAGISRLAVAAAASNESCRKNAGKLISLRSKLENVYEESSPRTSTSSLSGNDDDDGPTPTSVTTHQPPSATTILPPPTSSIPIISSTTRLLKNLLSSLVSSWRNSSTPKTPSPSARSSRNNRLNRLLRLPRGLRDNRAYVNLDSRGVNAGEPAGRPSLGDELHEFRRDTMPRLMSRYERRRRPKDFSSSPDLTRLQRRGGGLESSFDRLLVRSRSAVNEDAAEACVATVKPRRRSKCDGAATRRQRLSLDLDGLEWSEEVDRWQGRSVASLATVRPQPVQAPTAPKLPPAPPTGPRKTTRDSSTEPAYAEVGQFIGRARGPKDDDPLYDVPRRLVAPPPAYHTVQLRLGQAAPRYENVGLGGSINGEIVEADDQRLQCTAFTTF